MRTFMCFKVQLKSKRMHSPHMQLVQALMSQFALTDTSVTDDAQLRFLSPLRLQKSVYRCIAHTNQQLISHPETGPTCMTHPMNGLLTPTAKTGNRQPCRGSFLTFPLKKIPLPTPFHINYVQCSDVKSSHSVYMHITGVYNEDCIRIEPSFTVIKH